MSLELKMHNIRNIKDADMCFPFSRGLYAIVGENGCGKSTIMLALSLTVKTSSAHFLRPEDLSSDSFIDVKLNDKSDHWFYKSKKLTTGRFTSIRAHGNVRAHNALVVSTHVSGFYEGSIFYGCRFDDFASASEAIKTINTAEDLVDADSYVSEALGYILHNNKVHYSGLKRMRSRDCAQKYGFTGIPYFCVVSGGIITQFQMSSGECMLLSLLDFINNLIIKRKSGKKGDDLFFLIDEVELALHPGAIDRLVSFLDDLVKNSAQNLIIYFSTHSAELIHRIHPRNIFLIENENGNVEVVNPCYPNYAVRSLYIPNGFDFLILVEDELAKALVEKIMRDNNLGTSKLCCVLPAGGWSQMLKLHHDMITYNAIGVGKHILSVYDGDAKDFVKKKHEYDTLPKVFLPVSSIEKYLKRKCIDENDSAFIKLIGDKYFTQRSLKDIIFDYKNDPRTQNGKDNDGKNFYSVLISNLEKNGILEMNFIKYLCDDIVTLESSGVQKFTATLARLLS